MLPPFGGGSPACVQRLDFGAETPAHGMPHAGIVERASASVAPTGASTTSRIRRCFGDDSLRSLLAIGLLPNLLLLPAAVSGDRAVVKVEYLVLAALERFVSRSILAVLLTVTLLLDVLITFAPVFNFGPVEIVDAVEQVVRFQGRAIAVAVAVPALIAALAMAILWLRGRRSAERGNARRVVMLSAAAMVLSLGLDIANGSNAIGWRARTTLDADVASSLLASEYLRGWNETPDAGAPVHAATDVLRSALAGSTANGWTGPRKIVLVIVESMGVPRGVSDREIWTPFMNEAIAERYEVRTGRVPFLGSTTAGEFRELCGIRMTLPALRGATLPSCLPQQLRSLGYETIALHGYEGTLFERLDWYPRVGFDRMRFDDQLASGTPIARCGRLFHGICDSTAIAAVRGELTRDPRRRQFVYWLTLSSHFPLGAPDYESEGCHSLGAAARTALVCQLWTALWPALDRLAALAADTTTPPALYVIVGDHMPPQLLSHGSRRDARASRFQEDRLPFSSTEVPFLVLEPRAPAAHDRQLTARQPSVAPVPPPRERARAAP